jgi:hypothetical protein
MCVSVTAALCPFKVRATDSSWKSASELGSAERMSRDTSDEAESSTRDDGKNRIEFELRQYKNGQISLLNGREFPKYYSRELWIDVFSSS